MEPVSISVFLCEEGAGDRSLPRIRASEVNAAGFQQCSTDVKQIQSLC